jgi:hypothetical protein
VRYLYEAGHKRRKMHLAPHDPLTGDPMFSALCGMALPFNRTCNLPLGRAVCKACAKAYDEMQVAQWAGWRRSEGQ